jgi:predicted nucleic acid-binding protein
MKPVFADTSYYVALLSEADQWHDAAVEQSARLLGRQVVTEYVLVELGSALSNKKDRALYVPFVAHLLADVGTRFVPASAELFQRGLTLFAKRLDKNWSLVDCISFVVMRQQRLTDALTTDHHFIQAGFKALLTGS